MSEIQKSVRLLADTLDGKNQDYTGSRGEFFNFEKAAQIASIDPLDVMMSQIGIKITRLQALRGGSAQNEPFVDSFLDLAGYAIIAHAYMSVLKANEDGFDYSN